MEHFERVLSETPDNRNFLRDILWIGVPCSSCIALGLTSLIGAPLLKYRIYDVLAGQGVTILPKV